MSTLIESITRAGRPGLTGRRPWGLALPLLVAGALAAGCGSASSSAPAAGGTVASGTAADGPGPAEATLEGAALHASLTAAVAPVTRELYAGFEPGDLAAARRVLTQVTKRAGQLLT